VKSVNERHGMDQQRGIDLFGRCAQAATSSSRSQIVEQRLIIVRIGLTT
jgi:hypothetical protein